MDFACSNNAIVQDEQLCQAITAMWSRIGIKAKLRTMPAVSYYPMAQRHEASIALLSWGVPTFDALYTLQSLTRTKTTGAMATTTWAATATSAWTTSWTA